MSFTVLDLKKEYEDLGSTLVFIGYELDGMSGRPKDSIYQELVNLEAHLSKAMKSIEDLQALITLADSKVDINP